MYICNHIQIEIIDKSDKDNETLRDAIEVVKSCSSILKIFMAHQIRLINQNDAINNIKKDIIQKLMNQMERMFELWWSFISRLSLNLFLLVLHLWNTVERDTLNSIVCTSCISNLKMEKIKTSEKIGQYSVYLDQTLDGKNKQDIVYVVSLLDAA